MAELLVKAQEPWNNDDANAPSYRSRMGDIVVVRPDGWVWGKEECLPRFIVVKVPMTEEEAKFLESQLLDETDKQNPVLLKHRRYALNEDTFQAELQATIDGTPITHKPDGFDINTMIIDKAT